MANQVKVTVIDPIAQEKTKLRVAAYARVSSDSADQLNSYLAQVDYYTRHIAENPDWELADVYADDGIILGTSQEVLAPQGFPDLVLIFIWPKINGPYGRLIRKCVELSPFQRQKHRVDSVPGHHEPPKPDNRSALSGGWGFEGQSVCQFADLGRCSGDHQNSPGWLIPGGAAAGSPAANQKALIPIANSITAWSLCGFRTGTGLFFCPK